MGSYAQIRKFKRGNTSASKTGMAKTANNHAAHERNLFNQESMEVKTMSYIYKLAPYIKGCDIMRPTSTDYSDEYAQTVCDYYITDEMDHKYRLHSSKGK